MLLGQSRQVADCGSGGVARADYQDILAGIGGLARAEDVLQAVSNMRLGRGFADGRNTAVSHPAMLAVRAGAVEDDVGFFASFLILVEAHEQSKRLPAARGGSGLTRATRRR